VGALAARQMFCIVILEAASPANSAGPARAGKTAGCPTLLTNALRLVVVTTPSINHARGKLTTYRRATPQRPWIRNNAPIDVVVGRNGLAWGWTSKALARTGDPLKQEGDKRTPAGVFTIGRPFGTQSSKLENFLKLRTGQTFCVDDTRSPH